MNKMNDSSGDQCFQVNNGMFYLIRLMKKVTLSGVIIMIFLLSGCKTITKDEPIPKEMPVDQIDSDYQISSFQLDDSKTLEYRDVYHNNLSIVELEDHETYYVSTHLYLMDLKSKEITEVTAINRGNDEGRIWNFIELSDKSYLYTNVTYTGLSDFTFMDFEVIHLKEGNKKMITKGGVDNIYELPVFTVDKDAIYIPVSSYDEAQDKTEGNYRIELWKFDTHTCEKMYSNTGRYDIGEHDHYSLEDECEFFSDRTIYINNNGSYFVTGNSDQTTMNKIEKGRISKTPLTEKLVHAIPLGHKYLVTERLKNTTEPDALISYVLDDHGTKYDLKTTLRLEDYCVLEEGIVGFYKGNTVILKDLEDRIGMTVVPELKGDIYFRKVDGKSVLVFKNGTCYNLTVK